MGIPIIGDVIDGVKDIISEFIVDKDKKIAIDAELKKLEDAANARAHAEKLAQIEVNKQEASHGSIFVAGWRPAVGWVCAAGLAAQAIVLPLLGAIFKLHYDLDTELLLMTLGGMLGIGGMRTYEKVKGVSTNDYTDRPDRIVYAPKKEIVQPLPEDAPWKK